MRATESDRPSPKKQPENDQEYDAYVDRIQKRLTQRTRDHGPLFTTDAQGLFEIYLANLPLEQRQHHTCRECRHFFEQFAGLAVVDKEGMLVSALWAEPEAPDMYRSAAFELARIIMDAKITGVFYADKPELGRDETNGWHHMHLYVPFGVGQHKAHLTGDQAAAEKLEDRKNVLRALQEYKTSHLEEAVRVLGSDTLFNSQALAGAAQWLLKMSRLYASRENNLMWREIALAPAGFCHPRAGMLGTLLEDLVAGMSFAEVKRRFDEKMHPLSYQRPTAPPKAGNVEQAEKIFERLGLVPALRRRFALLEEVLRDAPLFPNALWWSPRAKDKDASRQIGGVFGRVMPKLPTPAQTELPSILMTLDKFRRMVLPTADKIEYYVHSGKDNYSQLCAACDPNAPPILQWDSLERRNPYSWYVYGGFGSAGSLAQNFNLTPGRWTEVEAVVSQPSMWGVGPSSHIEAAFFLLEGCEDKKYRTDAGLALFPSCLKAELHEVRTTIEAYSQTGTLEPLISGASAAGLRLQKGAGYGVQFRVTSGGKTQEYTIDRWD